MPRNDRNYRNIIKKIANRRMLYLFQKAHEIYPERKALANRYIYLARRYAQRAKIKIPDKWKKRICHKCKQFLYPGLNCRIRMQSKKGKGSHVTLTCFDCNNITRYYIKTKNKKKET
ncbi:MAG: ribonuclease P protein component 4 [Promethearchaeota archaeon]|jgi:ribonuclease P protein subunit RPR2